MKIDLEELIEQQIISAETAEKIKAYYQKDGEHSNKILFLVFGILGALLVSLGIILIIAHNWDQLGRGVKTFLAVLPLLLAQAIGFYTLKQKYQSKAWREVSAILIFFAIAASISMVAQVYHISGDRLQFLLTWLLLALPLIYIFRSSFVSILYLVVALYFFNETHAWRNRANDTMRMLYWLLLALQLPYYFYLIKTQPKGNFTAIHHWLIAGSVLVALSGFESGSGDWMFLAYIGLLGVYVWLGYLPYFNSLKTYKNAYKLIGVLGLLGTLLFLSFNVFWKHHRISGLTESLSFSVFWIFTGTILLQLFLQRRMSRQKNFNLKNPVLFLSAAIIFIYFIDLWMPVGAVLTNLTALFMGLYFIRKGNRMQNLLYLNFGMLIIIGLIIARFFDSNLSFVVRGILFVLLGLAFFMANYILLKRKK